MSPDSLAIYASLFLLTLPVIVLPILAPVKAKPIVFLLTLFLVIFEWKMEAVGLSFAAMLIAIPVFILRKRAKENGQGVGLVVYYLEIIRIWIYRHFPQVQKNRRLYSYSIGGIRPPQSDLTNVIDLSISQDVPQEISNEIRRLRIVWNEFGQTERKYRGHVDSVLNSDKFATELGLLSVALIKRRYRHALWFETAILWELLGGLQGWSRQARNSDRSEIDKTIADIDSVRLDIEKTAAKFAR